MRLLSADYKVGDGGLGEANETVEVKALQVEINNAKVDHSVGNATIGHAQEMMWQAKTTPSTQENERCLCTDDE